MVEINERIDNIGDMYMRSMEDVSAYLECSTTTAIEQRGGELGRVVLATEDLPVGSRPIRESPVIVWKNCFDFFSKYKMLSGRDQNEILDMHCSSINSRQMEDLIQEAKAIASRVDMKLSLIHKLMVICKLNAHQYRYDGDNSSSLFIYGSKVSHSCIPNTSYTSDTDDGKLEYKVIRPIKSGEMITFSYLGHLWEIPTHNRRSILQNAFFFKCQCPRCMAPDYARDHYETIGKMKHEAFMIADVDKAVKIKLSIVLKLECIAAECNGCGRITCKPKHEPVYEAAATVFFAAQDLIRSYPSSSTWPFNVKFMIHRYIPALKLHWGNFDEEILEIEKVILGNQQNTSLNQCIPMIGQEERTPLSEVKNPLRQKTIITSSRKNKGGWINKKKIKRCDKVKQPST